MPFYDPGYLGIERTDEIVFVQVFLSAGRSTEQKKAFYARVASLLTRREWHLAMKRLC
jgi:4-oxalocrotonate tautomerase